MIPTRSGFFLVTQFFLDQSYEKGHRAKTLSNGFPSGSDTHLLRGAKMPGPVQSLVVYKVAMISTSAQSILTHHLKQPRKSDDTYYCTHNIGGQPCSSQ